MRFFTEPEAMTRYRSAMKDGGRRFLAQGYGLQNFADDLGVNRTYASRFINQVLGTTFNDIRNRIRLQHMLRVMAENPELSKKKVAARCGFTSTKAMNRIVKNYTDENGKLDIKLKKV